MSHSITDHKTVEEVILNSMSWEDPDGWAIIGRTKDKKFEVAQHWNYKFETADTLLEAFHLAFGPNCYCDDNYE